jgi:UMP-CMP kinase family protein
VEDVAETILARILHEGFEIVEKKRVQLTKAQVKEFYACHSGKPFFNGLVDFMASGTVLALRLQKEDAIAAWRKLIGPTNSEAARTAADQNVAEADRAGSWTLRALYGTDGGQNAAHGSDSKYSAQRELQFFFGYGQPSLGKGEKYQRTLAMIKPDAVGAGSVAGIVEMIEARGFVVVSQKKEQLTTARAEEFYAEHKERGFFSELVGFMTSGPVMALALEKHNAIEDWRMLMGPTNTADAKECAPDSTRARFGTDGQKNATHGSDSAASAARELAFWFPGEGAFPVERTFAMIKPGTADDAQASSSIMAAIEAYGFSIVERRKCVLTPERARTLYAKHEGESFFEEYVAYMSSGPVWALVLSRVAAIQTWRTLMGPDDVSKARKERPSCLRALHGQDGMRNGTHGSESEESAKREMSFFFQSSSSKFPVQFTQSTFPFPSKPATASEFVKGKDAGAIAGMHKLLVTGLAALSKAEPRPEGLEATRWLGQYMLDNNPKGARVGESADAAPVSTSAYSSMRLQSSVRGPTSKSVTRIKAPAPLSEDCFIVFVLGGPGSGKGTQCAKICQDFDFCHLSTGDLLRAEVKSGSVLGQSISSTMQNGDLVSNSVTMALLKKAMLRSGERRFLVDGFPRDLDQAFLFEREIGECRFVLYFDCPPEVMKERIMERGKTSGRADDNEESIMKRLDTFTTKSKPVIDFYKKVGKVRSVSATASPEEIFLNVRGFFEPEVVFVLGGPGSGKGTQCERIVQEYGYHHLSSGDLLRAEAKSGSAEGREIQRLMENGQLVPVSTTLALIKKAMATGANTKFLIDGFPRSVEQAQLFEKTICVPSLVLEYDCTEEEMLKRLLKRGLTSGRVDDNSASIKKRFNVFRTHTKPVADFYATSGLLRKIDATHSPDRVFQHTMRAFTPEIVFVLGGPGCGKGTQCDKIVETYGFGHLSAGDLLRAEVFRKSAHGKLIDSYIKEGKIVPQGITIALLKKAMLASGGLTKKFLVDGFPRAMDQALEFEKSVGQCSSILFFDCPEAEMRKRILHRAKAAPGRADDNEETLIKRFRTYMETSMPVITHYSKQGLVRTISAIPPAKEVFEQVKRNFGNIEVVFVQGGAASEVAQKMSSEFGFVSLNVNALLDITGVQPSDETRIAVLNTAISRACVGGGNGRNKSFVVEGFGKSPSVFQERYPTNCCRVVDTDKPGQSSFDKVKGRFQPLVVLIVGAKGSGIQSVASYLGQELGFTYLNVWDLLMVESGAKATKIQSLLARKRFPLQIALDLVKAAMNAASIRLAYEGVGDTVSFRNPRFLIDGFPRRLANERDQLLPRVQDQWFAFEEQIAPIAKVLHLQCADVEIRKARLASSETGSLELSGDMEEIYENELAPITTYASKLQQSKSCTCLDKSGNFVLEIDTQREIDTTFHANTRKLLEPILA